jgi:hypothetical protein
MVRSRDIAHDMSDDGWRVAQGHYSNDRNTHLFTAQALRSVEGVIEMMAEHGMVMTLPKGTPTLLHMRSKRYSCPDNVFCTVALQPFITKCEVLAHLRPTSTDHFPILTVIDLPQTRIPPDPSYNFRIADWEEIKKTLTLKLDLLPQAMPIENLQQLEEAGANLTKAIQETIEERVTRCKPRPDAKRWWNEELTAMRKDLNRLRSESFRNRAIANHPSHRELRCKSRKYGNEIILAKRAHWTAYLEEMSENDIWTANKYIKSPAGDGGMSRIPTIKTRNNDGSVTEINNNKDKAKVFAKVFFPPPPPIQPPEEGLEEYPDPLPDPPPPEKAQIGRTIMKLSPYKARGWTVSPTSFYKNATI